MPIKSNNVLLVALLLPSFCMGMSTKDKYVQAIKNGYITKDDTGFHVIKHGVQKDVARFNVDSSVRDSTASELNASKEFRYLRENKMSDGTYNIKAFARGKGGGLGGATAGFWVGKFVSEGVCHGVIWFVAGLSGPAAPAVGGSAEACLFPFIEGITNTIALGTGIIGGVLTGPV
jgi:hypothetical protein